MLDSIVKNVGTPYTVYLGRSLFSTFMDAYTLVDNNTRRNMEGMLKTWKERVPGSIDPRPVFPVETVRPIETALLKAKTAAIQNQRHVQPQGAFRGPATPPQHNGQFVAPAMQHMQQPFPIPGHQQVQSHCSPTLIAKLTFHFLYQSLHPCINITHMALLRNLRLRRLLPSSVILSF